MIIFYCISTLIGGHAKHISLMAAAGSTIRQRRAGLCATLLLLHHHHHRRHFFFLFFLSLSFFFLRPTTNEPKRRRNRNRKPTPKFFPQKKNQPFEHAPNKRIKGRNCSFTKKKQKTKKGRRWHPNQPVPNNRLSAWGGGGGGVCDTHIKHARQMRSLKTKE